MVTPPELPASSGEHDDVDAPLPTRKPVGRHKRAARRDATRSASVWVLVIAILQLVFGLVVGFVNSAACDENIESMSAYETVLVGEEEKEVTFDEYVEIVERERVQGFVMPIGLALAFFGLYFWARKSPLPALVTALCLFVAMHALAALEDPKTLMSGIIIKAFFLAALIKGIRSAIEQRAARADEEVLRA